MMLCNIYVWRFLLFCRCNCHGVASMLFTVRTSKVSTHKGQVRNRSREVKLLILRVKCNGNGPCLLKSPRYATKNTPVDVALYC